MRWNGWKGSGMKHYKSYEKCFIEGEKKLKKEMK